MDKPKFFTIELVDEVPVWVKNTAGWWADDKINNSEFISMVYNF